MAYFDRKVWKQLPPRCFSPIACFTLVCSLFQVHHKTPEWRVHSKKHPNDASVTFLSKEDQCTDLKKKRCICLHNLKDWMLILVYLHSHSLQLTETYRTCTFYFEKWVGYTVIFVEAQIVDIPFSLTKLGKQLGKQHLKKQALRLVPMRERANERSFIGGSLSTEAEFRIDVEPGPRSLCAVFLTPVVVQCWQEGTNWPLRPCYPIPIHLCRSGWLGGCKQYGTNSS
jgi:hypothetical protein